MTWHAENSRKRSGGTRLHGRNSYGLSQHKFGYTEPILIKYIKLIMHPVDILYIPVTVPNFNP